MALGINSHADIRVFGFFFKCVVMQLHSEAASLDQSLECLVGQILHLVTFLHISPRLCALCWFLSVFMHCYQQLKI